MKYSIIAAALLFLFISAVEIFPQAAELPTEESLNYTYLGPVLSLQYSSVEYTEWDNNKFETKEMSGISLSGGVSIDIFADNFCGDFQMKYAYSGFDYSITYADFSIAGKYYYPITSYLSAGGGIGLYFETPPSNRKHNGSAGLVLPLSVLINTASGSKLFFDLAAEYGSFGAGENSKSISAGINAGFIFKVGRI